MALERECKVDHSSEATQKKLSEIIFVCLCNWMGEAEETE